MIRANHLVKTFKRQIDKKKKEEFNAVGDISLEIHDGELVGILGPNGAGKTTLLRMLATLMSPTSGEIEVTIPAPGSDAVSARDESTATASDTISARDGIRLGSSVEIRRHLGYLSANTKLYERFSVREIMRLFGQTYGMSDKDIDDRTEYLTDVLDLGSFIDNRVAKLSTGQMQRTQIARCLIHDPEIYIFDEPTLGLDIISSQSIIDFMTDEKKKGKTIIYSTHYMEEAKYLCDRVILLNDGKIVCEDTPSHLMETTGSDDMRQAFFSVIEGAGYERD
ncbi:MAG: ATP-binding cassette domain-containing protein [Eubacterium sp.]|nr:ATP-binding cassette domain-containing protein [Eubacterium sp.]